MATSYMQPIGLFPGTGVGARNGVISYNTTPDAANFYPLSNAINTFGPIYLPQVYGSNLSMFELGSSGNIAFTVSDVWSLQMSRASNGLNPMVGIQNNSAANNSNVVYLKGLSNDSLYISAGSNGTDTIQPYIYMDVNGGSNTMDIFGSNGINLVSCNLINLEAERIRFAAPNLYFNAASNIGMSASNGKWEAAGTLCNSVITLSNGIYATTSCNVYVNSSNAINLTSATFSNAASGSIVEISPSITINGTTETFIKGTESSTITMNTLGTTTSNAGYLSNVAASVAFTSTTFSNAASGFMSNISPFVGINGTTETFLQGSASSKISMLAAGTTTNNAGYLSNVAASVAYTSSNYSNAASVSMSEISPVITINGTTSTLIKGTDSSTITMNTLGTTTNNAGYLSNVAASVAYTSSNYSNAASVSMSEISPVITINGTTSTLIKGTDNSTVTMNTDGTTTNNAGYLSNVAASVAYTSTTYSNAASGSMSNISPFVGINGTTATLIQGTANSTLLMNTSGTTTTNVGFLSNVAASVAYTSTTYSNAASGSMSEISPVITINGTTSTLIKGTDNSTVTMNTNGTATYNAGFLSNVAASVAYTSTTYSNAASGSMSNISPFVGLNGTTQTFIQGTANSTITMNTSGTATSNVGFLNSFADSVSVISATYSNAARTSISEIAPAITINGTTSTLIKGTDNSTITMNSSGTVMSNATGEFLNLSAHGGVVTQTFNGNNISATVPNAGQFQVNVKDSTGGNPVLTVRNNTVQINGNMVITGVIETENVYTSNKSLLVEDRNIYLGMSSNLTDMDAPALAANSADWIKDSDYASDVNYNYGYSNSPPGLILAGLPTGIPQYSTTNNNEFYLGKSFTWNYNYGNVTNIGSNLTTSAVPKESFWELKGGSFRITQPVNVSYDGSSNVTASNVSYHFRINAQSELEIIKVVNTGGPNGTNNYARVAKFGRQF